MAPMMLDDVPMPAHQRKRSLSSGRPFLVSTATHGDVPNLVDIEFRAFAHEHVNHVLSYRDYSNPGHVERTQSAYSTSLSNGEYSTADRPLSALTVDREAKLKSLPNKANHDSNYCASIQGFPPSPPPSPTPTSSISGRPQFWKVTNAVSGEIMTFSKWELKSYTPEELHAPEDLGHEDEPQMNRDWFALNERVRREYMGTEKHCYIAMLATKPEHQHNGAGTLLLNRILAAVDAADIPYVYLEATATARPIYEKHGFRALRELRFDPADYGVEGLGIETQTVMLRERMAR